MAESERKLKNLLMQVKEKSEKAGLKLNIKTLKLHHLVSSLYGKQMGENEEIVTDLIILGFKITANGDFSHEIKRCLLLGRKAITELDRVLKNRNITLPIKIHLVKAMAFQQSCMNVRVGPQRRLSVEELIFLNCVLEKTLESPLDCKEIKLVNPKGYQP